MFAKQLFRCKGRRKSMFAQQFLTDATPPVPQYLRGALEVIVRESARCIASTIKPQGDCTAPFGTLPLRPRATCQTFS